MTIRNLDSNHDWTFGTGKNNYLSGNDEIALNLETRILSFFKDCFFAINEGLDWWNLLGTKKTEEIELAVQNVITQTPGVTAVNSVDAVLSANRKLSVTYDIQTVFSQSYQNTVTTIDN